MKRSLWIISHPVSWHFYLHSRQYGCPFFSRTFPYQILPVTASDHQLLKIFHQLHTLDYKIFLEKPTVNQFDSASKSYCLEVVFSYSTTIYAN